MQPVTTLARSRRAARLRSSGYSADVVADVVTTGAWALEKRRELLFVVLEVGVFHLGRGWVSPQKVQERASEAGEELRAVVGFQEIRFSQPDRLLRLKSCSLPRPSRHVVMISGNNRHLEPAVPEIAAVG